VTSLSRRREQIRRAYQFVHLTNQLTINFQLQYVSWKLMRRLFTSQISLRLNSLQMRGDCARRSISMPSSTMNSATRTAPLSLINLITLSQFPRRRCDRPDCRRAIQSHRFSSRPLSFPCPSFSPRSIVPGYEIPAAVMTRRKYR